MYANDAEWVPGVCVAFGVARTGIGGLRVLDVHVYSSATTRQASGARPDCPVGDPPGPPTYGPLPIGLLELCLLREDLTATGLEFLL